MGIIGSIQPALIRFSAHPGAPEMEYAVWPDPATAPNPTASTLSQLLIACQFLQVNLEQVMGFANELAHRCATLEVAMAELLKTNVIEGAASPDDVSRERLRIAREMVSQRAAGIEFTKVAPANDGAGEAVDGESAEETVASPASALDALASLARDVSVPDRP